MENIKEGATVVFSILLTLSLLVFIGVIIFS